MTYIKFIVFLKEIEQIESIKISFQYQCAIDDDGIAKKWTRNTSLTYRFDITNISNRYKINYLADDYDPDYYKNSILIKYIKIKMSNYSRYYMFNIPSSNLGKKIKIHIINDTKYPIIKFNNNNADISLTKACYIKHRFYKTIGCYI